MPRTVLCFGDSNTHGTVAMKTMTDRRRFAKADRWPSVMAEQLGADWEVIAEGHPGRTSVFDDPIEGLHKNGLRVLQALLESHRPVDLVIIMLGTNDLKARFNLTANDIALGIQRLAVEVARSDAGSDGTAPRVLLAAPVSVIETGVLADIFAGATQKSQALPETLAQVAKAQNAGFVDLNSIARVDPVDGIHLDAVAQRAIGKEMARAVTDLMN